MNVRRYTLPSTQDERLQLRADIERDAAVVLGQVGFQVTDRHRHGWGAMEMPQLRRCTAAWKETAVRFASLPPKSQTPPVPVPSPASSLFESSASTGGRVRLAGRSGEDKPFPLRRS